MSAETRRLHLEAEQQRLSSLRVPEVPDPHGTVLSLWVDPDLDEPLTLEEEQAAAGLVLPAPLAGVEGWLAKAIVVLGVLMGLGILLHALGGGR